MSALTEADAVLNPRQDDNRKTSEQPADADALKPAIVETKAAAVATVEAAAPATVIANDETGDEKENARSIAPPATPSRVAATVVVATAAGTPLAAAAAPAPAPASVAVPVVVTPIPSGIESRRANDDVAQILTGITSTDWAIQAKAVASIRKLCAYHTQFGANGYAIPSASTIAAAAANSVTGVDATTPVPVMHPHLPVIVKALNRWANDLRSALSKAAVDALADLYRSYGPSRHFSAVLLSESIPSLCRKASLGEEFIQEKAEAALAAAVQHVSAQTCVRFLCKLDEHKDKKIRQTACQFIATGLEACSSLPASLLLSVARTIVRLWSDGSSTTRNATRASVRALRRKHEMSVLLAVAPNMQYEFGVIWTNALKTEDSEPTAAADTATTATAAPTAAKTPQMSRTVSKARLAVAASASANTSAAATPSGSGDFSATAIAAIAVPPSPAAAEAKRKPSVIAVSTAAAAAAVPATAATPVSSRKPAVPVQAGRSSAQKKADIAAKLKKNRTAPGPMTPNANRASLMPPQLNVPTATPAAQTAAAVVSVTLAASVPTTPAHSPPSTPRSSVVQNLFAAAATTTTTSAATTTAAARPNTASKASVKKPKKQAAAIVPASAAPSVVAPGCMIADTKTMWLRSASVISNGTAPLSETTATEFAAPPAVLAPAPTPAAVPPAAESAPIPAEPAPPVMSVTITVATPASSPKPKQPPTAVGVITADIPDSPPAPSLPPLPAKVLNFGQLASPPATPHAAGSNASAGVFRMPAKPIKSVEVMAEIGSKLAAVGRTIADPNWSQNALPVTTSAPPAPAAATPRVTYAFDSLEAMIALQADIHRQIASIQEQMAKRAARKLPKKKKKSTAKASPRPAPATAAAPVPAPAPAAPIVTAQPESAAIPVHVPAVPAAIPVASPLKAEVETAPPKSPSADELPACL